MTRLTALLKHLPIRHMLILPSCLGLCCLSCVLPVGYILNIIGGVVPAGEGRDEHEQVDDRHQRTGPRSVHQALQRTGRQLLEPGVRQNKPFLICFSYIFTTRYLVYFFLLSYIFTILFVLFVLLFFCFVLCTLFGTAR